MGEESALLSPNSVARAERERRSTLIVEVNSGMQLTEMLEAATRDEIEVDEAVAFDVMTEYDDTDVRLSVASEELVEQVLHQLMMTESLETNVRQTIFEDREKQLERFSTVYEREGKQTEQAVDERIQELHQWHRQQKSEKMKDFWAVTGRRAGSLTLTVVRAKGLVPRKRNMISCDTQVVVQNANNRATYTSPVHYNSVDPEYDFETYLTLSDDRRPVIINIEGVVPKLGTTNVLATARLDLRHNYDNLVKDVTGEQVYVEKGHVEMDAYDKDGRVYPSTSVTLKWKLESRHMHSDDFCSDCGSLEHRCRCPADMIRARRVKEYDAMLQQQRVLEGEQTRREMAAQAEEDAKLEEESRAQNEELQLLMDEVMFGENDGRRRIVHSEATAHLFLLDMALNGATKKLQLKWSVEVAVLAGSHMLEGSSNVANDDMHVLLRYMALWRLNAARRKIRGQQADLIHELNVEKAAVMKTLQSSKRHSDSVRRDRSTEERKRQEMEEYNEGVDDLAKTRVDQEGIPRATRVRDEQAPVAELPQEQSKCCIVC